MHENDREPMIPKLAQTQNADLKEGEDYYREGPYVVFTERYHLKRGFCCNSGCRHCPYRQPAPPDLQKQE